MVIDEGALGGQAATTESLDNYPGFPDGISGGEWAQRTVTQARRFGVEFLQAQTVAGLRGQERSLWVKTGDGIEQEHRHRHNRDANTRWAVRVYRPAAQYRFFEK